LLIGFRSFRVTEKLVQADYGRLTLGNAGDDPGEHFARHGVFSDCGDGGAVKIHENDALARRRKSRGGNQQVVALQLESIESAQMNEGGINQAHHPENNNRACGWPRHGR
jgi:hypothetical protein